MSGGFFYWFMWVAWIVVTFFYRKSKKRTIRGAVLLMMILVASVQVTIFGYEFGLLFLLIQGACYVLLRGAPVKKLLYRLIVTWMIGAAYGWFHFLELYDPVILIVDRVWLLSGIVCAVVLFLSRRGVRSLLLVTGIIHGEWLVFLTFQSEFQPILFGQLGSLDVLVVSILIIGCWEWLEERAVKLASSFDRPKQASHKTAS